MCIYNINIYIYIYIHINIYIYIYMVCEALRSREIVNFG